MPIYLYHNEETGETREVFQNMKDKHEYFGEDGTEYCWKRVFTIPQASIDSQIDPFKSSDFVDKTGNKKGTYGDLLDRSAELSEKRAELNGGIDPVKRNYFDQYSKERKGAKHPNDKPKKIDGKNFSIEF